MAYQTMMPTHSNETRTHATTLISFRTEQGTLSGRRRWSPRQLYVARAGAQHTDTSDKPQLCFSDILRWCASPAKESKS
jgi:hypothetical protein